MLSYKCGSPLFFLLFQVILVRCQDELLSNEDENPPAENPSALNPSFQSLFKLGDFSDIEKTIQDDLRRMSEIMDGKFTDEFPLRKSDTGKSTPKPSSTTEGEIKPSENLTDSGYDNKGKFFLNEPLITFEKLFKTLEELTKPAEMSSDGDFDDAPIIMVTNLDIEPERIGKLGEENDPLIEIFSPKVPESSDDEENSKMLGFLDDLFDKIFTKPPSPTVNSTIRPDAPELKIKIEDHGFVYNIPPNAYIDSTYPGMVKIFWNSDDRKMLNNSLCLKVFRDENGHIVFQHVHLLIRRENQTFEYNLENPIHLNDNEPNTIIKLSEGVQLNFPNFDSLDVIIQRSKEKYSTHWVLFMVAVLGLIIALFVMLLSYVIHSKNRQFFPEKDDLSKQPIA